MASFTHRTSHRGLGLGFNLSGRFQNAPEHLSEGGGNDGTEHGLSME